ncbi:MAG: PBP1b-binding outer membrane lipoprotein LpoB [Glaciecola sp.]|jgi:PBP1b-binding outer membrane lipoprotein LpoB
MTWTFDICLKNRKILEGFLNQFTLEELNKIPEGFSNNIIWNIAHVIVTQQLLVYRNSDLPMFVSDNMVDKYKKGTNAEVEVSQAGIEEIKSLLFSSLEKLVEDYNNGLFKNYNEYTVSTKSTLTNAEEALEFNNFHEGIHLGYILALKKSL